MMEIKEGMILSGLSGKRCTVARVKNDSITILFKAGDETVRTTVNKKKLAGWKEVK
jgi:hypothetical protein